MVDQQMDEFSIYPSPLQDELRGLYRTSKAIQLRAGYLQELFDAVRRNDKCAAEVVLGCLCGRYAEHVPIGAADELAMLLIRPVASEVKLLLPPVCVKLFAMTDMAIAVGVTTTPIGEMSDRLGVFERMHDSSTHPSAHDAILGFTMPVTAAWTQSKDVHGLEQQMRIMEEWGGELPEQEWTVFKDAIGILAENDVPTLRKTLETELTDAVERLKAEFYRGIGVMSVADTTDDGGSGSTKPRHDYSFRREGANFKVLFDGEKGDIPCDLNGSWYICWLLQRPNVSMSTTSLRQRHATENGAGAGAARERDKAPDQQGDAVVGDLEDTSESIEYYEQHAGDLAKRIEAARECKDQLAVDRLLDELEQIFTEIRKLKGKDGKPRQQQSSDADRVAVTSAINSVITKCRTDWAMPRLSKHLADKISTGSQVCYQAGESPPTWVFS